MLKVAIVGFGTVGQAVARLLIEGDHKRLQLTHIVNRNIDRKKVDWIPPTVVWTDEMGQVMSSNADVVVELIGGIDSASEWIRESLRRGKSVVTANKQIIAERGPELIALAAKHDCHLLFEAAVAGGVPVIRGVRDGLAGDRLIRLLGILNGTCNFILTRMEKALVSFDDALDESKRLGYAEADPSADLDGIDSRAKLAILSMVGLRRQLDVNTIPLASIRGIEPIDFIYARRLNCSIRQVARAEVLEDAAEVKAFVRPALVPLSSHLARVEGNENVVVVSGTFGGETAFSGAGAGGSPTAVAVVSDLEAIVTGGRFETGQWLCETEECAVMRDFTERHYVRFIVADSPGIIGSLATTFSRYAVNIDSVLQDPGWSKNELPFVITLESCSSKAVDDAMEEISGLKFHVRPPLVMPILSGEDQPL